jgi:anti-sigma regulatory factor (Ser/Thr protein kinase)|nr:MAG: hypothetical protein DIU60_05025 [Actinomycetota bacterium]
MKGALSQMATRVRGMGLAVEAVVVRFRRRRTRRRRYTSGTAAPYRRGKQGRVPVTISRTFAAAYEQVKAAREFVREQVGDDHPRAYDLMLVTSELAGNAIQHGGRRDGTAQEFVVSVTVTPDRVIVAVRDGGMTGIPHVLPYDEGSIGGRGLALVEMLSKRWGFERDSDGTVVWAELDEYGGGQMPEIIPW